MKINNKTIDVYRHMNVHVNGITDRKAMCIDLPHLLCGTHTRLISLLFAQVYKNKYMCLDCIMLPVLP